MLAHTRKSTGSSNKVLKDPQKIHEEHVNFLKVQLVRTSAAPIKLLETVEKIVASGLPETLGILSTGLENEKNPDVTLAIIRRMGQQRVLETTVIKYLLAVVPLLVEKAKATHKLVHAESLMTLTHLAPWLEGHLQDPDEHPPVQRVLSSLAGLIRMPEASEYVVECGRHEGKTLAVMAVTLIGHSGGIDYLPFLNAKAREIDQLQRGSGINFKDGAMLNALNEAIREIFKNWSLNPEASGAIIKRDGGDLVVNTRPPKTQRLYEV